MPAAAAPVGSSDDHGQPGLRLDERALRLPAGLVARRATTGWWRAWPAASGRYLGVDPTARAPRPRGAHLRQRPRRRPLPGRAGRCSPTRTPAAPPPAGRPPTRRARGRPRAPHPRHACSCSAGPGWCCPPGWCGRWRSRRSGFGLVWARTDEEDRTRGLLWRAAGGGLLLVVGLGVLFASGGVLSTIGGLGLAVLATGVGVALLLGPWIVRLWRDLGVERRERIRSEERSEIAAHLHDSVLQTLALIQRADAPGRARTLARRQERELRAWLFDERPPDGDGDARHARAPRSSASSPTSRTATTSRSTSCVVGDCADGRRGSTRSWPPCARRPTTPPATPGCRRCRVYVEVEPHRVTAFVRDRGKGFDARRGRARPRRRAGVDRRPHGPPRRPGRGAHRARARAPRSCSRWPHAARERRDRPGCSSSTTTRCSAPACGPSSATPSRWWARRPTSSRPCRASAPPTPRSCSSTSTSPAAAARRCSRRSSRSDPTSCSSPCRCPTPPRTSSR